MTPKFTAPLIVEQIGHEKWRIVNSFSLLSSSGFEIKVHRGFETDFASIPAIIQGLIPKVGYWNQGAVVHDLLYSNHRNGVDESYSRLQADNFLLEGCKIKSKEFNVPNSQRRDYLIYGGVRIGGLVSWESQKEYETRINKEIDWADL